MKQKTGHLNCGNRAAFTLIELLAAIAILLIALSIAFQALSGTVRGWRRGMEVLDSIRHGDFTMNQLVSALNSTIYFYNARKTYAFKFEKNTASGLPVDRISFVTSSGAFMPHDSPFAIGPHRLNLFIDDDEYGHPALFAATIPAVDNDEEVAEEYDAEPFLVLRFVQGLKILFWDEGSEEWGEVWEKENAVPERILLTLFAGSADREEEPVAFSRMIEIPVAPSVKERLTGPTLRDRSKNPPNRSGNT